VRVVTVCHSKFAIMCSGVVLAKSLSGLRGPA
jgi:hypothetical protein